MEYKNSFVLYESVGKQFQRLIDKGRKEEALLYISSVLDYGLFGKLPPEESEVWFLGFDSVVATISSAKTKYSKRIDIPEEKLIAELESGKTQEEIASIFNCSIDTIQRRIKQYNLSQYRKTASFTAKSAAPQTYRKNTASSYNDNDNENQKDNDNGEQNAATRILTF